MSVHMAYPSGRSECLVWAGGWGWISLISEAIGSPISDGPMLSESGVHGDWWVDATDDVWAVDLDNMKWNEVLAPTQQ